MKAEIAALLCLLCLTVRVGHNSASHQCELNSEVVVGSGSDLLPLPCVVIAQTGALLTSRERSTHEAVYPRRTGGEVNVWLPTSVMIGCIMKDCYFGNVMPRSGSS